MKNGCYISWILILLLSNGILAQNAPVTTTGTGSTVGTNITISITAANFSNISSCNLQLNYDSTIARATAVVTGPLLGGNVNSNLTVPGTISLGWYIFPSVTLEGDPVLFNITFTRIDTGTSAITWHDDGYTCIYYDGSYNPLNDIPTGNYYINGALTFLPAVAPAIFAPVLQECAGKEINVPARVADFKDVGKFTLTMHYDSSVIHYLSFTSDAGYPNLTLDKSTPGTIITSGIISTGLSGITLPNSAVLFTLHFTLSGDSTSLTWSQESAACGFSGPPPDYVALSDVPQNLHYINGSVNQYPLPAPAGAIEGPPGGYVHRGQQGVIFSISEIPDATGYEWSLPHDLIITSGENTNTITVSVGNTFITGNLTVSGYNICENGTGSPEFQVTDTTSLGIHDQNEGTSGNDDEPGLMLESFPNPFSGKVTFNYCLPAEGRVLVEIMNLLGDRIMKLVDQVEPAGNHSLQVNSVSLRPGIYMVRMKLKKDNNMITKCIKMICSQ